MSDVWAGCVSGTVLCLLQDAVVHAMHVLETACGVQFGLA